jgi:hypothetical protein
MEHNGFQTQTRDEDLTVRITSVGRRLAESLQTVIDAVPGGPHRPQELSKRLGINKDLSSRVLAAAQKKDPLAVAHAIPGPEPLRRLLNAARGHGVASALIGEAEQAIQAFDSLIRNEVGDRASLDAVISAWLPEARERFELLNKQSIFRGFSRLRGVHSDVEIDTAIVFPSAGSTDRCDGMWLNCILGLQRIRPGTSVIVASRNKVATTGPGPLSVEQQPIADIREVMLEEFCDRPPGPMVVERRGDNVRYCLRGDAVGPRSAVDVVLIDRGNECLARYREEGGGRAMGPTVGVETPTKLIVIDVLLHEGVYDGIAPTLAIHDTAIRGIRDVRDPEADVLTIDLHETITDLGRGVDRFRLSDMPNYVDLLRHVLTRADLDPEKFRGFRCRAQYPVYGSQISMAFMPPPRPV